MILIHLPLMLSLRKPMSYARFPYWDKSAPRSRANPLKLMLVCLAIPAPMTAQPFVFTIPLVVIHTASLWFLGSSKISPASYRIRMFTPRTAYLAPKTKCTLSGFQRHPTCILCDGARLGKAVPVCLLEGGYSRWVCLRHSTNHARFALWLLPFVGTRPA